MTAVLKKYIGHKFTGKDEQRIVNLDVTLTKLTRDQIKRKLAGNAKAGRFAEMSFADAGLTPNEL